MPDAIKPEEIQDLVAEKLEAAGFWRRASARWRVVMNQLTLTDAQREWIR